MTYRLDQFRRWVEGDKSIVPGFAEITPNLRNQPRYGFAEMLTLRHYHEAGGWKGFASYALGAQYPRSPNRQAGRLKVEEVIPRDRLDRLRELRSEPGVARTGGGEPDLFLYQDDGQFKFVEVKKAGDRLRGPQLTCIAQILAVLGCEVDIVYVRREDQRYRLRTYRFDLVRHTGEKVAQ